MALLGMLSGGDELSGYDIKKWSNWVLRFFYQSSAYSQIYRSSRSWSSSGWSPDDSDGAARSRRLYRITPLGMDAVSAWTADARMTLRR